MKYIDAEELKVELDRQKIGYNIDGKHNAEYDTCVKVLRIIDSLQQEQPEVDLDENTMKEEFRMIDNACLLFNYDKLSREQLIARRFYQLGLNARKEE